MEEENAGPVDLQTVSLRPFRRSDIDTHNLWAGSPERASTHPVKIVKNRIDHPWCRAICVAQKPIGDVSVKWESCASELGSTCRANIEYRVTRGYRGKGIATQAVKLATRDVFRDWPRLRRIQAVVDVQHVASQRVLEKAGFSRECVLRSYSVLERNADPSDMVMYSLLRSDVQDQDQDQDQQD